MSKDEKKLKNFNFFGKKWDKTEINCIYYMLLVFYAIYSVILTNNDIEMKFKCCFRVSKSSTAPIGSNIKSYKVSKKHDK